MNVMDEAKKLQREEYEKKREELAREVEVKKYLHRLRKFGHVEKTTAKRRAKNSVAKASRKRNR